MTTTKPQIVFADSLEVVKERIKALQAEKTPRNEILIQLNKLIHDAELFSQKQRANVVRELNKDFGLKVSMSEIKRAIKTVNTATKPNEKATPVDGLGGNATLDLAAKPPVAPAAEEAADVTAAAAKPAAGKDTASNKPSTTTTSENTTMAPVKETLKLVSDRIAVDAPRSHEEKVGDLLAILAGAGATTEEARQELINGFIAANPAMSITWNLMKNYPQGEAGIVGTLVAYMEIDPENKAKFEAYLAPIAGVDQPAPPAAPVADLGTVTAAAAVAASAPAAPAPGIPGAPEVSVAVAVEAPGLKERVMTTIRGNRETGFSSGVVAATTALVGGGLEMAFKGNATIGSGVGTAVGATGAYFLAESTDKLMDSETGRYLLAGAIGVVAGGLGSRIGRGVQDGYLNPSSEVAGALETLPGAPVPAPQPGGLVGNSEALLGMFNL
jgi:hypothetical protein